LILNHFTVWINVRDEAMTWKCQYCAYAFNEEVANDRCLMCGKPAGDQGPSSGPSGNDPISETEATAESFPSGDYPTEAENALPSRSPSIGLPLSISSSAAIAEGRVSQIERHDEKPQADVYKFLTGLLIFILFFVPLFILSLVSLTMCIILAIFGFYTLAKIFNPKAWIPIVIEIVELFILRGIGRNAALPMYRGLVEGESSGCTAFQMQGPLKAGNIFPGHHVRLSGKLRQGTLVVHEGIDMTTGARVLPYKSPWKPAFIVVLFIYIILFGGAFFSSWR